MARIFISHSWANNAETLALRDWLVARGWDDLFLDIDSQRGLVSGQHWLDQLQESAQRCKAVLFVLSRDWLASKYCIAEFWEARKQERPLFAVVIDDTAVAEVPAEIRGVWQLVFLTQGSHFETFSVLPPPAYAPAQVRFSHEGLESLRRGLARAGLTSFETESFPWPARGYEHEADGTTPRRPYRGLKPVDVPDAGVFFGRDADLVRARDHLAGLRDRGGRCLVVLLGASGSGKSSFLRAGLLPRLARDDHHFLPLPVLRPRGAALWGDDGLLAALEKAHRQAELPVTRAELRKDLEEGGAALFLRLTDLRSAAARGLPEDAKPPTLVIPIDQAEELFTSVRGETGATEDSLFLDRLAEILRHGPEALVLVTIRSDAYEPLQTAEALAGVLQVPFNLPPLTAADYRSVIEGPARRVSDAGRLLDLEPELVRALLADTQGADALPLLSFTLERLYVEHGGDGTLTLADYDALGGVQGSIEAAVAEAFANPDAAPRIPAGAAEREALLKRSFVPHLMGVNEANGEPVRRTARQEDLPEAAQGLIKRLIDHRLLVIDLRVLESGAGETVIEVAHEALLRRWPTLRRWHDQERVALEIQQEVDRASTAWSQNACGADWLAHRGARLAEAEAVEHREDFSKVFMGVPRAYLNACRETEDAARNAEATRLARQRELQRRVSVLLMVVAIVTLVGGWLVVSGQRDLARQELRLIAANAKEALEAGQYDRAMRLSLVASQGTWFAPPSVDAGIQLGRAAHFSRLEAQLSGHRGAVESASFSPDGTRIVTSGDDTARVWSQDTNGAWVSVTLEGHGEWVTSAVFSPDGTRIVTASWDDTARVWNQDTNGAWASVPLEGHGGWVTSAVFSPDGTRIATASEDSAARVWSQDTNGAWASVTLEGHGGRVASAVFSPDGTRIVTASWDDTARVWSQDTNGAWTGVALEGHRNLVTSAAFSLDGTRIVTASQDNTARVWSQEKGGLWHSAVLEGHKGPVASALFSPNGGQIVTASDDGTVRVWSQGEDGTWASVTLEGHQQSVVSAAFSPDGAHIVTGSDDRTARVWRQDNNGAWHAIVLKGHGDVISSASFSPDCAHVVTASNDGTARVWSIDKGGAWASIALEGHQDAISSASFSPDGISIVTASLDRTARVWRRGEDATWHSVALKGHEDGVTSASFSPDGVQIVTASRDRTGRVWSPGERGSWHSVVLKGHEDWIVSASFSPDGARIVTVSADKTARVWNRGKDGSWTSVLLQIPEVISSAAFSPDGVRIITGSKDKTVRIWYLGADGTWFSSVLGRQGPINSVAFSKDGKHIVAASRNHTAQVWSQGEDGAWIWTTAALEGHRASVSSAAFSPDSSRIVTASEDHTARVWSRGENGGWTSIPLGAHQGWVYSGSFSPEGAQIVTASGDKFPHVWNVRWLMGSGDWAKAEPFSLPETVCREKLRGSLDTVVDLERGRDREGIAVRLLTADDIRTAPILAGREGEDVCAPFLETQPWWSRLAFWR